MYLMLFLGKVLRADFFPLRLPVQLQKHVYYTLSGLWPSAVRSLKLEIVCFDARLLRFANQLNNNPKVSKLEISHHP